MTRGKKMMGSNGNNTNGEVISPISPQPLQLQTQSGQPTQIKPQPQPIPSIQPTQ
jgi:hypothetical protein